MVHLENDLWQVYREQGLTVLGVDMLESPSLVAAWIELKGLTYPIVIASTPDLYLRFTTGPFPFNAVIGRDGTLRHSAYGFDLVELEGLIVELLDEDPAPAGQSSWSEVKALYGRR